MSSNDAPTVVSAETIEETFVGANGDEGAIKRLIGRQQDSSVLLGLFRLEPGQRGSFTLPHVNGTNEEIYYLLEGRLRVSHDGGEVVAGPGEAIYFPPGGSYTIETVGDTPVRLVWTAHPAP